MESGYDVNATCRQGKAGEIEFGFVGGVHYGSIRIGYADWASCRALVNDGGGHGAKVSCAAAFGYAGNVGRNDGWGGPTKTEDKLKPESLVTLGGVQVLVDGMVVGSPQHQVALAAAAAMRRGPARPPELIVLLPPCIRKAVASSRWPSALWLQEIDVWLRFGDSPWDQQ